MRFLSINAVSLVLMTNDCGGPFVTVDHRPVEGKGSIGNALENYSGAVHSAQGVVHTNPNKEALKLPPRPPSLTAKDHEIFSPSMTPRASSRPGHSAPSGAYPRPRESPTITARGSDDMPLYDEEDLFSDRESEQGSESDDASVETGGPPSPPPLPASHYKRFAGNIATRAASPTLVYPGGSVASPQSPEITTVGTDGLPVGYNEEDYLPDFGPEEDDGSDLGSVDSE